MILWKIYGMTWIQKKDICQHCFRVNKLSVHLFFCISKKELILGLKMIKEYGLLPHRGIMGMEKKRLLQIQSTENIGYLYRENLYH